MLKLKRALTCCRTVLIVPASIRSIGSIKNSSTLGNPIKYHKLNFTSTYSISLLKSEQHKQVQRLYKQYGWSQQYQKRFYNILVRQNPNVFTRNIVNEEGTYLLELFTETARQNLAEDSPQLNERIYILAYTLYQNQYNSRALRVFRQLQANFQKYPGLKKSLKNLYVPSITALGKLLQDKYQFKESLEVLNKFKDSFEDFDENNKYIDDFMKKNFYYNQGSNNLALQNLKQGVECFKKAAYFAQKTQINQSVKKQTMISLNNYALYQSKFGDRVLGKQAYSRIATMLNLHENPELIIFAITFCTNCCDSGFEEISENVLKEMIQVIEEKSLKESQPLAYFHAHRLLINIYKKQKKYEESLSLLRSIYEFTQKISLFVENDYMMIELLIEQSGMCLLIENQENSYKIICQAHRKIMTSSKKTTKEANNRIWEILFFYDQILSTKNESTKIKIIPILEQIKKEVQIKVGKYNPPKNPFQGNVFLKQKI